MSSPSEERDDGIRKGTWCHNHSSSELSFKTRIYFDLNHDICKVKRQEGDREGRKMFLSSPKLKDMVL